MDRKKVQAERSLFFVCLIALLCACTPEVKTTMPPGSVACVERGILDVTASFPGAGNFSDYNALALPASKVCSDKSIFGTSGKAVCQDSGGVGVIATAAQVVAGTYFWDASGANRAGTMTNKGGAWDLTTAFPGTGYYSGITPAITTANVCNNKNFLGSAGTAVCESGSATTPAAVTDVFTGKEYWDSTGTKQSGTMSNRGSAWDLTTAFPGTGYYSGVTSALSASDVCTTKNILGSTGTAVCNSTYSDLNSSQAYRADNATIDLSSTVAVAARARATLTDEAAGNATYTANHLYVPNPKYDTDGQGDDTGIGTTLRNYLVTVKGRPTVVCGLAGLTSVRVNDCATRNTTKAVWEGKKYGQAGEGDWKLVTLYKSGAAAGAACAGGSGAGCYEVWQDQRTQLIWSDYISNGGNGYNWFQATGYSSNASTTAVTGKEGRANVGTDCVDAVATPVACQPAIPISACAHAASIANLNGVVTYQNPDGTNGTTDETPEKGNISGATAGWRLPTYSDWATAYANGIAKVLPSMTGTTIFWTATSYSTNRNNAWTAGYSGLMYPASRDQLYGLRCVGH